MSYINSFIADDFLLSSNISKKLFNNYAKQMPIIDYHCHLDPKEIYKNKKFKDITEIWLSGDHYKWRLMRSNGISEKYITGTGNNKIKFKLWAKTLEKAIGNPLYEWSHIELKKYFGINDILTEKNADSIYNKINVLLQNDDFKPRCIIANSNVKLLCTTDDPVDNLEFHKKIAQIENRFKVLPAFRPDRFVNIELKTFNSYLNKFAKIKDIDDLENVIVKRIEFFAKNNCTISDHGIDYFEYIDATKLDINKILKNKLANKLLSRQDIFKFKTYIYKFLAKNYAKNNWVMQVHFNANRNLSTKALKELGQDMGFDAIGSRKMNSSFAKLLNSLEIENLVPKMVIYSLNPNDWLELLTIAGCFVGNELNIVQKLQFGSAWWFNDTRNGIRRQLKNLMDESLLGNFIGMLTDSRSFISYVRHDYFRRVLCELLGEYINRGQIPNNLETIGAIVKDISFNNTNKFFNFNV